MPAKSPSSATDADRATCPLARLRGPEIQFRDGSLIADDLHGEGDSERLPSFVGARDTTRGASRGSSAPRASRSTASSGPPRSRRWG